MLGRAAAYYRRFLGLHAEQDVQTLKAKMALAAIDKALQPPPSSGQPDIGKTAGGAWIDLIRLVDPARHTYTGRWRRRGGTLSVASSPHARLVVPISPKGSYELEVAFTRSEGHEEFFSLPAGDGAIGFVMNGWERQTGVNDARKQWIPAQSTEIGRKYTVRIRISLSGRRTALICYLDGRAIYDWQSDADNLSAGGYVRIPASGVLGLGAERSAVLFHSVRLRMLTGTAQVLPLEITRSPVEHPR